MDSDDTNVTLVAPIIVRSANDTNATSNNGANSESKHTWGTTQIMIVFLIIVFAVLIAFLVVYYYFIRRMKSRAIARVTNKSVSGSISEDKGRNIFANPERHLAVDQSVRNSPGNSSLPSDTSSQNGSHPPTAGAQPTNSKASAPVATAQPTTSKTSAPVVAKASPEPTEPSKKSTKSSSKGRNFNVAGTLAGLRDIFKESSGHK